MLAYVQQINPWTCAWAAQQLLTTLFEHQAYIYTDGFRYKQAKIHIFRKLHLIFKV